MNHIDSVIEAARAAAQMQGHASIASLRHALAVYDSVAPFFDVDRCEVIGPLGRVHVPPQVGRILRVLCSPAGRTVCIDRLLDAACNGSPDGCTENVLRVRMWELRRALEAVGSPARVATIRSLGYRLETQAAPIEIEHDAPPPRRRRYQWASLNVGDSFFVPAVRPETVRGSIAYARWKTGFEFQTESEGDGIRVRRIK